MRWYSGTWPAGEGAGHAGGIVSAAVDGLHVGRASVNKAGIDMEIAGFVEEAKALLDVDDDAIASSISEKTYS